MNAYFEFRDAEAIAYVKKWAPEWLVELPSRAATMPVYDGNEVVLFKEVTFTNPDGLAIVSFITGNNNPAYDGWIIRYFGGVKKGSDEYLRIYESFEKHMGCPIQHESE